MMSDALATGLFVAGRGSGPQDGLHLFVEDDGAWRGRQLATVDQLSSLAWHPTLPVIYGTSGLDGVEHGRVHAWNVADDDAIFLNSIDSQGVEPCHLSVDGAGRMLVVANYQTSTLGVQMLHSDGSFDGDLELLRLTGGSIDPDRQDDAHPHQVVFDGDRLYVVDLGADLLREFKDDRSQRGADALVQVSETPFPAGTGPRHLVILPAGRFALSAELSSEIVTGKQGSGVEGWRVASSTKKLGPAQTRHSRNYPGDITGSVDGRLAYFANRGYDTISTFDVSGAEPRLLSELDAGVAWPQHLLLWGDQLLVAGWDGSQVMAMPLSDGLPGQPKVLLDCAGAGWLLPRRSA
jgi:6-phosphogluconolactonase (cycloisomerase 2 family)